MWFAGCNMRCLYCYNPDIVLGKGKMSFDDVFTFLNKRKNLLDAVVLSGGECTMHKHLKPFITRIKSMGFLVKIDTNGSNPALIRELVEENLVDYVSLDYKATKAKFQHITQSDLYAPFEETLDILTHSTIQFEVRTTVHSELLNTDDIKEMSSFLHSKNYQNKFYLQQHINHTETVGNIGHSENNLHKDLFENKPLEIILRN